MIHVLYNILFYLLNKNPIGLYIRSNTNIQKDNKRNALFKYTCIKKKYVFYMEDCRKNIEIKIYTEIIATHLVSLGFIIRACDSPFFFTINNKECTIGTHDFLVGIYRKIQSSVQVLNSESLQTWYDICSSSVKTKTTVLLLTPDMRLRVNI